MAYFILGHGYEDIESERQTMPEGTILVTATECGRSVLDKDLYAIMDELWENPDIAKTPDKFPPEIRKRLRIYNPGDDYPTVYVSPFMDFDAKDEKNIKMLEKSGVYPIPLPFTDEEMRVGRAKSKFGMFVDNSEGLIDKMYKGSLISPPLESIKGIYENDLPISMLSEGIPIKTIFEKLGKGIYYFTICRSVLMPSEFNFHNLPNNNANNSLQLAKHFLGKTDDPRIKRNLEKKIFTIEKVIRPRSAKKLASRSNALAGTGTSRRNRRVSRKQRKN
jgi:hypothetical protein